MLRDYQMQGGYQFADTATPVYNRYLSESQSSGGILPDIDLVTLDPTVQAQLASSCVARAKMIAEKLARGEMPNADDIAFATDLQANPQNYRYADANCIQHSPYPPESGFTMEWWMWAILAAFAANEIGFFGKNKFQLFGPLL